MATQAKVEDYGHPATHPADVITQDENNRFVTDAQIAAWDALIPGEFGGTGNAVSVDGYLLTATPLTPDTIPVRDATGKFEGDLKGDLYDTTDVKILDTGNGAVRPVYSGDVTGDVTGNVTGDTAGIHTGDVTGNVTGNLAGDVTGDVYASDGIAKVLEAGTDGSDAVFTGIASKATGALIDVQIFTTSGTNPWTKPAGCTQVEVWVVGGGGGAGGIALTSAGQGAVSGGGGGGATAYAHITSGLLATESVSVGAGGSAGVSGAGIGGLGDLSSFGAHCIALGGGGSVNGVASSSTNINYGNYGGQAVGCTGDIAYDGAYGQSSWFQPGVGVFVGGGGSSLFSTPTNQIIPNFSTSSILVGIVGQKYGGGAEGTGGNAGAAGSTSAGVGTTGGSGLVIVKSYY